MTRASNLFSVRPRNRDIDPGVPPLRPPSLHPSSSHKENWVFLAPHTSVFTLSKNVCVHFVCGSRGAPTWDYASGLSKYAVQRSDLKSVLVSGVAMCFAAGGVYAGMPRRLVRNAAHVAGYDGGRPAVSALPQRPQPHVPPP